MNRIAWTDDDTALWARIAAHPFEPQGQALTFIGRLARDHGWRLADARRAVEEYRRFCFLAVTEDGPMTPSEEVDEVWHLHLTFSRDYWERWCGVVLRTPLHHQPTEGGDLEGRRFASQYARTLARYEARFGPPEPAIWPGVAKRFGRPRFATIDRDRALVIPLPAWLGRAGRRILGVVGLSALLSLVSAGPASALPLDVFDWTAGPFLTLYATLALAAVGGSLIYAATLGGSNRFPHIADDGPVALAFLADGEARAADTMALTLVQASELAIDGDGRFVATRPGVWRRDTLAAFATRPVKRSQLPEMLRPRLDPIREGLARRGLVLSRAEVARRRQVTAWLTGPVVAFGAVKVAVGLARDKPVGILVGLIIVTAVAGMAIAGAKRLATSAGQGAIQDYVARNGRAVRAPLPDEVLTAFAITGAAALVGTALDAHIGVFATGNGGDGGGGCGGGGGGGGGCGGCGGGD